MKTLTEMLKVVLPDEDEPELKPIKEIFKKWLGEVSLGATLDSNNEVWKAREDLITLVDEP